MYIPKSTVISPAVSVQLRNRAFGSDSRQGPADPPGRVRDRDLSGDGQRQAVRPERKPPPNSYDQINTQAIDQGKRLSELNPKLHRRTQTAINSYESLQYLGETEQRESVSRLLGIDLYA